MGIYPPTHGKLSYKGKPVNLKHANDRFNYSKVAQIIFQDPYASLDPRMTVSSIIEEGMVIHNMYDDKRRRERVFELLEMVGLNREHANRFPPPSFPAASASASALPGPWPSSRNSSSATSPSPPWTCPSSPR